MIKVRIFRPDLDAASPRGQIPPNPVPGADPAARSPLHYLRLVVISGVRHGYSAPEARGRERKKNSAPAWPDRKSRPAQPAPKPFRGRRGTDVALIGRTELPNYASSFLPAKQAFQRILLWSMVHTQGRTSDKGEGSLGPVDSRLPSHGWQ